MACYSWTRICAKNKTLSPNWYRLRKVPGQMALVTDVIDEYGQWHVKSVAVDDEHEPPYLHATPGQGSLRKIEHLILTGIDWQKYLHKCH